MEDEKHEKREASSSSGNISKRMKLEECPHGVKCYRKNPHHFMEFSHSHLSSLIEKFAEIKTGDLPSSFPQDATVYLDQIKILSPLLKKDIKTETPEMGSTSSSSTSSFPKSEPLKASPAGTMLEKFEKSAPYNIFFTQIPNSAATLKDPNSLTFTDLLCPSLGVLKTSLQINFMIDIMWLMEQYKERDQHKKPLTILYGDEFPQMREYIQKFLPNVQEHHVKMKDPFGCHHSKIGIYVYDDNSLRIVVSTANLYYEDWNRYNQGLWLSDRCPRLPGDSGNQGNGESVTGFKKSLLNYLKHYNLPILTPWIDLVTNADFSSVKVFLVMSVPGKHYPKKNGSHVHYVADLLSNHCKLPVKTNAESEGPLSWGVIAQSSSMGSMGKSPSDWLRSTILRSLSAHNNATLTSNSNATLSIVFPSVDNVANGYWGLESGGCLPYSKQTNEKQRWLQKYLHQWKADVLERTRAMPHIKSYCRVSPCLSKIAYFLLTSANLSKSAWGGNLQRDGSCYVRSCEAGVLFLPHLFNEEYFEISQTMQMKNGRLFPFMYDLPLTEYKSGDYPWCN